MFIKLDEFWKGQKNSHVITIAPEDFQTIGFRSLFKKFDGKYSHVRAAARIFWKYGILMEMLSHLAKNYKAKQKISDFPCAAAHIKRWQSDLERLQNLIQTTREILRVKLYEFTGIHSNCLISLPKG